MAPAKPTPPNRRNPLQQPSDFPHVRWMALIIAIALMALSLILRLQPSLLPKDSSLASDMVGKVGLVTLCMWLAWPTIEALWRAPGGVMLLVGALFVIGLFIYRPKTIWLTGPFLLVAIILAMIQGWLKTSRR
jgi:hypothetical protein